MIFKSIGQALVLAASAGLALVSCSSGSPCAMGCLDEANACQTGTATDACGAAGGLCLTCMTGQACNAGKCGGSATGGGDATGGGTASGGGSASSGGGGTASTGGGAAASGGGTASSGGGTAASGGGSAAGGGSASSGGGSAAGGGGTSGTGGGTSSCVPTPVGACTPNECAMGNNLNVGAYCTKGGNQCRQYSNLSCAIDLSSDGANFCIKLLCSANSDCGNQACCVGDGSSPVKACIPLECAVEDGGSVCPAP